MAIQTGSIWYSPTLVYEYIYELRGNNSPHNNEIEQSVEDIRIASVTALIMYAFNGMPAYVQLYKPDPPDAIVLQTPIPTKGTKHITQLEITTYIDSPDETLLSRLKKKKIPDGIQTLSENHILVVNLGYGLNVDSEHEAIREHMEKNGVKFPVWIIQEIAGSQDTITEVTLIDNQIRKTLLNLGELANRYKVNRFPKAVETKRAGSLKTVRFEETHINYPPPWETIGK